MPAFMQGVHGQIRGNNGECPGLVKPGKYLEPQQQHIIDALCAFVPIVHGECRCQVAPTGFHFFHEITGSQHAPSRRAARLHA